MRYDLDYYESAIAGDDQPYRPTPSDLRLRRIFWLGVFPLYLVGISILGWAVGTALRQWLGF